MNGYKKIVAAIDLTLDSGQVLSKAQSIATSQQAELHIIHIIEPLGYAYGGDIPMDLTEVQQQLENHARTQLSELGDNIGIPITRQHIIVGRPETEIHRIAEEKGFDLIVVGSHGRHGIQLLLGSTANGVLHGANCDVLAVRIK